MCFLYLKVNLIFLAAILCVLTETHISYCYKTEISITPSSIEEATTKKSSFFGGIKNLFRSEGSTSTTKRPNIEQINFTDGNKKPGKITLPQAPLMPLGPRPDTPPSPSTSTYNKIPQWPGERNSKSQQSINVPNPTRGDTLNPNALNVINSNVFDPYRSPKSQPSGIDLSYGGGNVKPSKPSNSNSDREIKESSKANIITSTTLAPTTKTIPYTSKLPSTNVDFEKKDITGSTTTTAIPPFTKDALPSSSQRAFVKEDFPPLPTPKTMATTPYKVKSSETPTSWGSTVIKATVTSTPTPALAPTRTDKILQPIDPNQNNHVGFLAHHDSSTTIRPGVPVNSKNLATDDEIKALTEILYTKEVNSQMNLIRISAQGKTRSIDSTDEAPNPLLEVDLKAFETPTIAKMRLLFNNYEMDTMVNEHVTPNERKEESDFLDSIMATQVMRQAMLFLQSKGLVTPDPKTHRDLVKEIWFTQYSRGNGKIGSSGFEHVFVNEVKNGTIIGLHNWVYFYDEEKAGRLNYMGYLNQLDIGTKAKIMKIRFTHNGLNKPVNTLFIGTSPELELALYTVCFQVKPDRSCPVSLGGNMFSIVTYSWRYRGKNLIGSAYPEI